MSIKEYPIQSPELYADLYNALEEVKFSKKQGTSNRRGFPPHEAMTFGLVKGRYTHKVGLSAHSKKYPEVFQLIKDVGNSLGFSFSSIHVNHNVIAPPHRDSKNTGESLLVSFGDYTGCNIMVESHEYNTNLKPVVFDGSKLEHWNTPLESGNKYSLVFYHHGETRTSQGTP